jgi:hypothetical protein
MKKSGTFEMGNNSKATIFASIDAVQVSNFAFT